MLKYELVKNSLSLYNTVVALKRYHIAEAVELLYYIYFGGFQFEQQNTDL